VLQKTQVVVVDRDADHGEVRGGLSSGEIAASC
jgi:hypothetical protein